MHGSDPTLSDSTVEVCSDFKGYKYEAAWDYSAAGALRQMWGAMATTPTPSSLASVAE